MNERAVAYLAQHGVTKIVDGVPEWMLPLDKLQDFLDLLSPDDVAPGYEHIQQLYRAQAGAVRTLQEQVTQADYPTLATLNSLQWPPAQNGMDDV
jgi:hypothetical protein